MRHVARVFWTGMSYAGSVDYIGLSRWAVTRVVLVFGALLILVGLLVAPLPIPLGLPMIAIGSLILINTSTTAKKTFVRWGRRYPRTVGRVRAWMGRRSRTLRRRSRPM